MPLGLWASGTIVAVSPTYSQEILHEEFGCGFQDFFRNRSDTLHGILNGLDAASFNPETDSVIDKKFSADDLSARKRNKIALQEKLGLPVRPMCPCLAWSLAWMRRKGLTLRSKA